MENINSWQDIHWRSIEKIVFHLQLRIFKAAKDQEYSKVYKLQKLLISSKSSKYLAVRKVTQTNVGKRSAEVDKQIIITPETKFALANKLTLDGKSLLLRKVYNEKPGRLVLSTIEDHAKQVLVYLALCPQWESQFEATSYGFRPGRSKLDAIENVFAGISNKPKWVLEAYISKCFDEINQKYLLDKCNTFPLLRKQICTWLKAGILEGKDFAFSNMRTHQDENISSLLVNIALHGLRERLDMHIDKLGGHCSNNRKLLTYVRYANDFILMYPDRKTLEQLKLIIQEFLLPIGLELHPSKTRIIQTLKFSKGFTFLGFDIIQKSKRVKITRHKTKQSFRTWIIPSKEEVAKHRRKIREIIRKYRGVSQERLIQILNPIIREWALYKRSQMSSKIFQSLDTYIWIHLCKWARKRHPKISNVKLKKIYWHKVKNQNWVFGVKKEETIVISLQLHSKIRIIRHKKVKEKSSPFDGNLIYWSNRTGKNSFISPIKL